MRENLAFFAPSGRSPPHTMLEGSSNGFRGWGRRELENFEDDDDDDDAAADVVPPPPPGKRDKANKRRGREGERGEPWHLAHVVKGGGSQAAEAQPHVGECSPQKRERGSLDSICPLHTAAAAGCVIWRR